MILAVAERQDSNVQIRVFYSVITWQMMTIMIKWTKETVMRTMTNDYTEKMCPSM